MDIKDGTIAVVISLISAVSGFGGAMAYVGGSLRQIEVNSNSIQDIRDHGTGILQSLKLQVQVIQAELDNIKHEFRPREYWETNAAAIATLQDKMANLEKGCIPTPSR